MRPLFKFNPMRDLTNNPDPFCMRRESGFKMGFKPDSLPVDNANGFEGAEQHRCPFCNRLLMRGTLIKIEVRCPRCKQIVAFRK